jgi:hypothetical protein
MGNNRLSDEEFRRELAALDDALRRPVDSARSPLKPLDRGFDERRDFGRTSSDPAESLRESEWSPPRRSGLPSPWGVALIGGLLVSGIFGWWLATHEIAPMASFMSATPEPSTKKPAASRAAPSAKARRAARNATPPSAAPSNAGAPNAKASNDTALKDGVLKDGASNAVTSSTIVPNAVAASTAVPSTTVASTTVPAAPIEAVSLPAAIVLTGLPSVSSSSMSVPVSIPASAPAGAAQYASEPPPWPFPYKSAIASRDSIPSAASVPLPLIDAAVRSGPPPMPNASTALAAAEAMAAVAADAAAIEITLREYAKAYDRLDAKAAVAVWPTVDQRALSRAFAGLASQTLVFRGCEVVVRAGAITATASCRGSAEYVRRVGDARVHVEPRQWTFTLNKLAGEWRIDAVDGQR